MSSIPATNSHQQSFNEAYALLNEMQKKAVDTIDGPVMVIAGPGTGKTQVLTLRIANILLLTDTAPESILALTFTEAGVKAMRERLRRYIGIRAYQVGIFTFHGFAERLIKEYPDAYPHIIGGRPASEFEKIGILQTALDEKGIKLLRPSGDPAYYITPILRMLSDLKKEYIGPDQLSLLIEQQEKDLLLMERIHQKGAHKGKVKSDYTKKEKAIAKNRELLLIYRRYEALLREQKLYDFEDMITATVQVLSENEEILRDLQETYHYFLADEHQDVNGSQNRILESLAKNPFHDRPNIFVVGDEKQAIYRFQGASLENFLYFKEQFPGTNVIFLTANYRSGQTILDGAHSLIKVDDGPLAELRVPLTAQPKKVAVIERRSFSHQAVEESWLADEVATQIASGTSPAEIAVIVRTNAQVVRFASALRAKGIAVRASAEGDIVDHPIIKAVEALLTVVAAPENERALFELLHLPMWQINGGELGRLLSMRSYALPLSDILTASEDVSSLDLKGETRLELARISELIDKARGMTVSAAPHRVLEFLLLESGLLEHVIAGDSLEAKRVVRRLYDEVEQAVVAKKITDIQGILLMLAQARAFRLPLEAPYITTTEQAVEVMTAHKSKGLEFEVVFVPQLQDSIWGGGRTTSYFDIPLQKQQVTTDENMDDEKRLFYVSMTRAKSILYISDALLSTAGKALMPSRLLESIDGSTITEKETVEVESAFDPSSIFAAPQQVADRELILLTLKARGFSATSFNNYLKNPWDYFYLNVLRIPRLQETALQFGTAVHAVMEYATKTHTKTGQVPSVSSALQKLTDTLARLPLSAVEFAALHERGAEAIVPYLEHLKATLPKQTVEEFRVTVVLPTGLPELPELPLTGNLDRIDFDDRGHAIRVVDYKTGKPKTRNAIEGKTASSDGAYKRQLVFYALLLELYGDERYQTKEGVLSFVEPDAKGQIHEEQFSVTKEEILELKELLIKAAAELLDGTWQQDPTIKEESEFSSLVTLLSQR